MEDLFVTAADALMIMIEPTRLMYLAFGVMVGLALGVIPGLGGIIGMALLLPFTFDLDPYSAFAFLLGMGSVTTTSDTIPAVLFGVPGTAGSAATVLDGHPMARTGQAGRAFGAAFTASMFGGVFGALLLAVSIPVLRPIMLTLGSPELLAFAVFGLCMVAVLSGGSPLRGLIAAAIGLMVSMIGADPQTGVYRWTYGWLYLWDGIHIVPVTLGLFALPELADMAIERRSIAANTEVDSRTGQWEGIKDTFRHWWLVVRCAFIGSSLGAIPGMGAAVIDWIAYGHAARTEKGASETFGKGDVRGVLASEGSNNAKEGGALVPTIAFGVPGSASMAILLGAFLIQGLVPGPDMLTKNLDVTYTMVWSVALANILGTGICFAFANQFAKIALIRYSILLPLILSIIYVGAYQGTRNWGDLFVLLFFGALGWTMKRLRWPRPPLILGVVLGGIVERYLWISVSRYGDDWLMRPLVVIIFAVALWGLIRPLFREVRNAGGISGMLSGFEKPRFTPISGFYVATILMFAFLVEQSFEWKLAARLVPQFVGFSALGIAIVSFVNYTFRRPARAAAGNVPQASGGVSQQMHFDIESDTQGMDRTTIRNRALGFAAWSVAFMVSTWIIGMLPTILIFALSYMRVEAKEPWRLVLPASVGLTAFCWLVFDNLLELPWPESLIGTWFPVLRDIAPFL